MYSPKDVDYHSHVFETATSQKYPNWVSSLWHALVINRYSKLDPMFTIWRSTTNCISTENGGDLIITSQPLYDRSQIVVTFVTCDILGHDHSTTPSGLKISDLLSSWSWIRRTCSKFYLIGQSWVLEELYYIHIGYNIHREIQQSKQRHSSTDQPLLTELTRACR